MTLLNTAAGVGENKATTEAENMQTANAILNKPKKVSSRPVEPVPFNAQQSLIKINQKSLWCVYPRAGCHEFYGILPCRRYRILQVDENSFLQQAASPDSAYTSFPRPWW